MTEFKTDISENGKNFELVFKTDNKTYFEKMQATARECIDNKPVTQFERIKAMSVEEMSDFLMDWFTDCFTGKAPMNVKTWLESEVEGE